MMIVFALSIHLFARMTLAQVRNFGKRKVNAFSFSEKSAKSAKLGVSAFAEGLGQFSSLAGRDACPLNHLCLCLQ